MSEFPSLPLFTDAFIADTGHLTAQETGSYLMLIMMAWRSPGCRLPDDDAKLARWSRVDKRTWARIKPAVMEFWALENGYWLQKRLSKERDHVSKRAEVARDNGMRGGRPKSLENNEAANPAGSSRVTQKKAPNPNPNPNPREESSETNVSSLSLRERKHAWPDGFEDIVWKLFPKKDEKKDGIEFLRKLHAADKVPFETIIDGIRRLSAHVEDPQFAPALHRWLRKERWNDELKPRTTHSPQGQQQPIRNGFVANLAKSAQSRMESRNEPDGSVSPSTGTGSNGARLVDHSRQVSEPLRRAPGSTPPLLDLRVVSSRW